MARRKAWNGKPPGSEAEARRFLLEVTQDCIERFGVSKVSLSDVALAAGVTRQTVYRYFVDADDLFNAAAVLASGGFLERMRAHIRKPEGLAQRAVESLVFAIREIPKEPHLDTLVRSGDSFSVAAALKLGFVQEEFAALSEEAAQLSAADRDEIAEYLVRLMKSFLDEPGPERSEEALRAVCAQWLVPIIEAKLRSS